MVVALDSPISVFVTLPFDLITRALQMANTTPSDLFSVRGVREIRGVARSVLALSATADNGEELSSRKFG